jgi:DNA primase
MALSLFEKAKKHHLPNYAKSQGYKLTIKGSRYEGSHCPCCEPSNRKDVLSIFITQDGDWRWSCLRCNTGGSVVDFAAHTLGVSVIEAAKRLANDKSLVFNNALQNNEAPGEVEKKPTVNNEALEKALKLLIANGHSSVPECVNYLMSRGLSEKTIVSAVRRGMLRFLPAVPFDANRMLFDIIGKGILTESGLLKPTSNWTAIAFRPIIFNFPDGKSAEFRLAREPKENEQKAIRYGSTKYPWWWKHSDMPDSAVHTVHVVEGVIDLLSVVELGLCDGEAVMAMPGVASWSEKWFLDIHKKYHPRFVLSLDNDKAGQDATEKIKAFLEKEKISYSVMSPPVQFKDWNEYLESLMQHSK